MRITLIIYKSLDPTTGVTSLYLQLIDPTRNLIGVQRLTALAGMLEEEPVLEQLKSLISEQQNTDLLKQIFSLPDDSNIIVPNAIATKYQSIMGDKRCGLFGSATVAHLANVFTGTHMNITPDNVVAQVKQAHGDFLFSRSTEQIADYIRTTAQDRARGVVNISGVVPQDAALPAAEPEAAADDLALDTDGEVSEGSLDGFAANVMMLSVGDDDFVAVVERATAMYSEAAVASKAGGVRSLMASLAPEVTTTAGDVGQEAPLGGSANTAPTAGAK